MFALKEARGIGTEATRAKVLETLKERGYLAADRKALVSTPLGREVIALTPPALKDPITTADWESRLEAIAQGAESLDAFLADQCRILPDLLAPILGDGKPAFPCPSCGAALNRRKRKKDGAWFWGCTAYPDCPVILPDDNGKPGKAKPRPALSEYACPACGKPLAAVPATPDARRPARSSWTAHPISKRRKKGNRKEDVGALPPRPRKGHDAP